MIHKFHTSFFIILFSVRSFSGQEAHGGDIAVSIFYGVMRQTLYCLESNPQSWNSQPQLLQNLKSEFLRTRVISVEKTMLNGIEVDAINYPSKDDIPKILINRSRWLNENLDHVMRSRLVLHEYLGIANYDDQIYQLSYDLIQKNITCLKGEVP